MSVKPSVVKKFEKTVSFVWDLEDSTVYKGFNFYYALVSTGPYTLVNAADIIPNLATGKNVTVKNDLIPTKNRVNFTFDYSATAITELTKFYVKVTRIDLSNVEENILSVDPVAIYPKGVLSAEEDDEKLRNVHLYGWLEGIQNWVKIAATYDPVTDLYKLSTDANISVTVDPSSITISDVVIKDWDSALKLDIKNDGVNNAAVVTANVLPLPTGASTEATQLNVLARLWDIKLDAAQLASLKNVTVVSALPTGSNTIGNVGIVNQPIVKVLTPFTHSESKQVDVFNSSLPVFFSQDIYRLEIYNNDRSLNDYRLYVNLNGGVASTAIHIPINRQELYVRDMYIPQATGIQLISNVTLPDKVDTRLEGFYY